MKVVEGTSFKRRSDVWNYLRKSRYYTFECLKKKWDDSQTNILSRPNAYLVNKEDVQKDATLFYKALGASKDEDKWWITNDASNYMTFHREWLYEYTLVANSLTIGITYGNLYRVKYEVLVRIKLPWGEMAKILKVWHILNITYNLISVGEITKTRGLKLFIIIHIV